MRANAETVALGDESTDARGARTMTDRDIAADAGSSCR
jgi:hypothetical protein